MNAIKSFLVVWMCSIPVLSLTAQEFPMYRYTVENMHVINSRFSELSIMPLNDSTYVLVSDRGGKDKYNNWIGGVPYDIFFVNRRNWLDIRMAGSLNTKFSDGPATWLSPTELFLTQTNSRGQVDSKSGAFIYRLNISHARWDGEKWMVKELRQFKHKQHSYAHPALTPDGTAMFYTSDRPGGSGGKDLYVSYRTSGGWSDPISLGPNVNSNRDETFPFYHPSGRLYFSSDRKDGYGGEDIYYTEKVNGVWVEPKNIGAPVNTKYNEYAIYFDDKMERGFFSSNRLGGRGGEDVYSIFVDKVGGKEHPVLVPDAEVEVEMKAESIATESSHIEKPEDAPAPAAPVPVKAEEAVHVHDNQGFVLLGKLMKDEGLQNVYFAIGSDKIDEEGALILDRFAELLEKYQDPVIELHAHADATGSYGDNIVLTEKRARSVMQYLIKKGVPMERMNYKAYGESSLYIDQNTDVRLNRRVEFRIKLYEHGPMETFDDWPGFALRDMIVLEPKKFYVQLAALSPHNIFNGYKLKQYGTARCYFQRGMYKYILGPFNSLEAARETLSSVRSDYRDAFVFKNY